MEAAGGLQCLSGQWQGGGGGGRAGRRRRWRRRRVGWADVGAAHTSGRSSISTDRSGDSRSHQWRLVVDGNVAYHLMHNAGKSWKIQEKVRAPRFEPWWVASHWTVLPLDYKPIHLQDIYLTVTNCPTPRSYSFHRDIWTNKMQWSCVLLHHGHILFTSPWPSLIVRHKWRDRARPRAAQSWTIISKLRESNDASHQQGSAPRLIYSDLTF
jgi:hypothetical protein